MLNTSESLVLLHPNSSTDFLLTTCIDLSCNKRLHNP